VSPRCQKRLHCRQTHLRQRIGSPFTSSGSRAGRLTPLRSCASEPKPLARTQSEIAFAERIGAAGPAVACGSAVNERVLAERRKPPGSGAKPCRPGAKNVAPAAKTFALRPKVTVTFLSRRHAVGNYVGQARTTLVPSWWLKAPDCDYHWSDSPTGHQRLPEHGGDPPQMVRNRTWGSQFDRTVVGIALLALCRQWPDTTPGSQLRLMIPVAALLKR
jgi:hypothetical protein